MNNIIINQYIGQKIKNAMNAKGRSSSSSIEGRWEITEVFIKKLSI